MAENKEQQQPQQESQIQNSFDIGLFSDCPENLQPQGTYRYAMDVVKADFTISEKGSLNANLLTNEKSTVLQFDLSTICINPDVIGNIYIDNYQYILFVVGSKNVGGVPKKYSGILLFNFNDSTCIELLTSIAIHSNKDDVLNFHTHFQIQGTFRIRRNGEKVIYWTDGNNPVRTLNIDQINEYTDSLGNIRVNMLTLMKRYSNIPRLSNIAVLGGGQLPVGTYSIAVRLIDDDLNTTAWITVSRQIVITNTSSNAAIQMTGGRLNSNSDISYTNSSSKIDCTVLGNTIDDDYAYVQFGLVAYNMFDTETALKIYLSAAVPILKDVNNDIMDSFYSFSSINGLTSTTASELIYKPSAIERAFTMCQVNNRLVLGNVEAAQIKWEKLQKYASAIFTEVAVKKVDHLHDITNKDSAFHPLHNIFDVGFQWGEIYSLGIVYVLDNGITSPVYHIPGVKNNVLNRDIIPDNNRGIIKMIPEDNNNECLDFYYDDSFGNDHTGTPLNQKKVRHHRIPLRTTYGYGQTAQERAKGFPIIDFKISEIPEESATQNFYLHIVTQRTDGGKDFVNELLPNPTADGDNPGDTEYDEFKFSVYYHVNTKLDNGEWTRTFYVQNGDDFYFTREDWNKGSELVYLLHTGPKDEKPIIDFISETPRYIDSITKGFFGANSGTVYKYDNKKIPQIVTAAGGDPHDINIKDYDGPIWYTSSGAVPATYYKHVGGSEMAYSVTSATNGEYKNKGLIRATGLTPGFYDIETALAKYPLVESEQQAHCQNHHAIWFSGRVNNCSRFSYIYKNNYSTGYIDKKRQSTYMIPRIWGGGNTNIGDTWKNNHVYQDESLSVLLSERNLINRGAGLRFGAVLSHAFLGKHQGSADNERATSKHVTSRIRAKYNGAAYDPYLGDGSHNRRCLTGNMTCYINGAAPGHRGDVAFQDFIRLAYSNGASYTIIDHEITTSNSLESKYPAYDNADRSSGNAPNWTLASGDDLNVGLEEIVYNVSVINKFCMRSNSIRESNADGGQGKSAQFLGRDGTAYYIYVDKDGVQSSGVSQSLKVAGLINTYTDLGGTGYNTIKWPRNRDNAYDNWDATLGYMKWARFWFDKFVYISTDDDAEVNMPEIDYSTYIPGFNFSNISKPPKEELDGHEIIGYYFVANKRDSNNSTILDSAYVMPTSKIRSSQLSSNRFICCGLTNKKDGSATFDFNKDWIQILSLKNKFLKEMFDASNGNLKFIPQYKLGIDYSALRGIYTSDKNHVENNRGITNFGSVDTNPFDEESRIIKNLTEDCFPGTSYSKSKNKISEEDKDGFSLYTAYKEIPITRIEKFQINDEITIEFLDNLYPLEMKDYQDGNTNYSLYNYSQDNNTLIAKVNCQIPFNVNEEDSGLKNTYLFGYLYRYIANPYFNWRELPFFEITPFIPYEERTTTPNTGINSFGGDTYVSPIKYTNSFFYNNFLKKRAQKKSWMGYLTGALKTVMGVGKIVAGVYGGGPKVIAQGANDVLQGGLSIATDVVMDSAKKNFSYDSEKLNKYARLFRDKLWSTHINTNSIPDDLIVTISEIINSLWFDSTINSYWRSESNEEKLYQYPCEQFNDGDYSKYLLNKWTELSLETEGNRSFIGAAKNELYIYNRDLFLNSLRLHYAIAFTYDDNAKQNEKHPYRLIYSEVSFTEERNDNYRIFLPNNYKDIEGMNGEIRNIFAHNTQLIVFTPRSALVFKPSYEEKIIGSIVSYVGTGSVLSIDPQNVINTSNGIFGGMTGRFGWILLNDTVYYIDEEGRSINMFSLSGRESAITSLSMAMIDKYCKDNIQLKQVFDYFRLHSVDFPHKDMPYGKNGVGYLVGYDNQNNRILFTKKDKDIQGITNEYVLIDGIYYETSGPAFDAIIEAHSNWDNYYIDYSTGEIVFYETEEVSVSIIHGDNPNKPNEELGFLYTVSIIITGMEDFNAFTISLGHYIPNMIDETQMIFEDVLAGSTLTITTDTFVSYTITGMPQNGIIITNTSIVIDANLISHARALVVLKFNNETSIEEVTGFDDYQINEDGDIYKTFQVPSDISLNYLDPDIAFFLNNQIMSFPYTVNESITIYVQNEATLPKYKVTVIDLEEHLTAPIEGLYDSGTTINLTFANSSSAVISTETPSNTLHTVNDTFVLNTDTLVFITSKNQLITVNSTNNDIEAYCTFTYNDIEYIINVLDGTLALQVPADIDVLIHIPKGTYQNFVCDNLNWYYNNGEYLISGTITTAITATLS